MAVCAINLVFWGPVMQMKMNSDPMFRGKLESKTKAVADRFRSFFRGCASNDNIDMFTRLIRWIWYKKHVVEMQKKHFENNFFWRTNKSTGFVFYVDEQG